MTDKRRGRLGLAYFLRGRACTFSASLGTRLTVQDCVMLPHPHPHPSREWTLFPRRLYLANAARSGSASLFGVECAQPHRHASAGIPCGLSTGSTRSWPTVGRSKCTLFRQSKKTVWNGKDVKTKLVCSLF
ncbi:unnamed protein product [Protopolystoma xenopodis]|uniref:Uncharacterized protein n=1 Tax=Protopolystoma xenopodis TaxID=117903 RepID=A0A448XSX0_9PLAT|nr:unnamed protein product [Protopolystoma xenopodis]